MDDLPPIEGEKTPKKKDPKLDYLLLQVVACAVLLLAALVIKLAGGGFYAEAREKYIELFEDQTSLSEVMETMAGVFQMTPTGDDSSNPPAADGSTSAAGPSGAPVSQPAGEDAAQPLESGTQGPENSTSQPPESGGQVTSEDGTEPPAAQPASSGDPPVAEGGGSAALKRGEEEDDVTSYLFDFSQVQTALRTSDSKANTLLAPVSGTVTSHYGYRVHPITGKYAMHGGLDLGAAEGTDIQSAMAGVVKTVAESDSYGKYIVVDHQNGFETWYAHCSKLLASEGEQVRQGDVIARVGQTGYATGPHCHFEVRVQGVKLNPEWLLKLPEAV
ncbi:MAG: peptidoglycan DD-metalloendopeptidase family protein [Clostridiales bacterium]|nr:peptidoglycan DD-metalloendopeptidase family protein [Clostridiales bacterium]